jgi:hypothetical protein
MNCFSATFCSVNAHSVGVCFRVGDQQQVERVNREPENEGEEFYINI